MKKEWLLVTVLLVFGGVMGLYLNSLGHHSQFSSDLPISSASTASLVRGANEVIQLEETTPLQVAGLQAGGLTKIGVSDDTAYGPLVMRIPTIEAIESVQLAIDSSPFEEIYFETRVEGDNTYAILYDHTAPLPLWLEDGTHTLVFRATTAAREWIAPFLVSIDAQSPVLSREGNQILATDANPIMGTTMWLFHRAGIEEPLRVEERANSTNATSWSVDDTQSLVANGDYFRLISVSDDHGNSGYFIPDDERPYREVLSEYVRNRPADEILESADFAGVGTLEYDPFYIFDNELDTAMIPGNATDIVSKEFNITNSLDAVEGVYRDAGKLFPYSTIKMKKIGYPATIVNSYAFDSWGVQTGTVKVTLNGVDHIKNVAVLDLTNPDVRHAFYQKVGQEKDAHPGKLMVVVVDHIVASEDTIAFFSKGWGVIVAGYYQLLEDTTGEALFDNKLAKLTFAHEIGHAYGLGHAKDIKNLMYPISESGKALDEEQVKALAEHTGTEGLLPQGFSEWFNSANSSQIPFTCTNRLLERGEPNNSDPTKFEETENQFAGTFKPSEAKNVELDDWKGGNNFFVQNRNTALNWKACPITRAHQYDPATGNWVKWVPVDFPEGVKNDFSTLAGIYEKYDALHQVPDIQFTPPEATGQPELYMCGCFTPCEIACGLQYAQTDQTGIGSLCGSICGNSAQKPTTWEILGAMEGAAHKGNNNEESCAANSLPFSNNFQSGEVCKDDCASTLGSSNAFCWSDCKCHSTPETLVPPSSGSGNGGATPNGSTSGI